MKFSVIIPVYKVEQYLNQCVDSVLNQSFKDFELILVDDGSPDNCPRICDDYAKNDARVKVIHQQNGGQACARNTGLSYAVGMYIIFLDSDDYLIDSTALEKINDKTVAEPDVILYGYRKLFESDGSFGTPVCNFPEVVRGISPAAYLNELLLSGSYSGTAWCKAIRTMFLKDNDIEFKPGLISEDHDWYVQVMMKVKTFAAINEALYVYRLRPGSTSHGGAKLNDLIDNLWIQKTWFERINEADISAELKNVLLRIWARYMGDVMVLYSSYDCRIRKQYRKQIRELMPLFDYAVTPRSITIKRCCKILGITMTSIMLHVAFRLRKRM